MKKILNGLIATLIVGLFGYLSGCGVKDEDYLAQLYKDGAVAKDGDENSEGVDLSPLAPGAYPPPMMGPPMPVRQLPTLNLRAPTAVEGQAPLVLASGEDRAFQQDIHHWRTIVRTHPTINNHTVNNVLHKRHFYHTNIVNQPTESTRHFATNRVFESQEVMPITEVTNPPAPACPPGGCIGPRLPPPHRGYGGRWGRRF
jgi:hypothetical protein